MEAAGVRLETTHYTEYIYMYLCAYLHEYYILKAFIRFQLEFLGRLRSGKAFREAAGLRLEATPVW